MIKLDIDDIVKRYLNGDSASQIGRDLGVSHKTITLRLKNADITIRPPRQSKMLANQDKLCVLEECDNQAISRGLCSADYQSMSGKGRLEEFPKYFIADSIFGEYPEPFETAIYVLKRDDLVVYVGSSKNPLKRLVCHFSLRYGKNITLHIIRNVPDEKALVEECREIVFWSDLGIVLDNTRTPETGSEKRRNQK